MDEKKFVQFKKRELEMKKYIWDSLGKGKVSSIKVEYTPVGEKIIVATDRPGLIIGSRGERINELTRVLKQRFKLENPNIEISEITNPSLDAQLVADRIALDLEKMGNLKFKSIAYRELVRVMNAGALGVEIKLSGKLPSDRAKSWRFAMGYLKKVGDSAKVVRQASSIALTKLGISGIKVGILPPDAKIHDKIEIDDNLKKFLKAEPVIEKVEEQKAKKPRKKKEKLDETKEQAEEKN
jgi:small subunit ribosomal protein S3